jgi:CheY-like chemotaxis protein
MSGTRAVLVVDDDRVNRMVLRKAVEAKGFAAIEADNGAVGVQRAILGAPVLILMDVMMPVLDGLGAIRRLRALEQASGRSTPVIAVTALTDASTRSACIAAGADFYLPKPVDLAALAGALGTYALPTAPAAIAVPEVAGALEGPPATRPPEVITDILASLQGLAQQRTIPGTLRAQLVALGARRALAALDAIDQPDGRLRLLCEVRTALLVATTPCVA